MSCYQKFDRRGRALIGVTRVPCDAVGSKPPVRPQWRGSQISAALSAQARRGWLARGMPQLGSGEDEIESALWHVCRHPASLPQLSEAVQQELQQYPERALLGHAPKMLAEAGRREWVERAAQQLPALAQIAVGANSVLGGR